MPPKKVWFSLVLIAAVLSGLSFRSWNRSEVSLPNEVLTDVHPHPTDPSRSLLASEQGLYVRGEDKAWRRILSLHDRSMPVRQLITHPLLPDRIFFVSEQGILEGDLKTGRSRVLFREVGRSQNRVHALAFHPEDPKQMYLATEKGLFVSRDGGRHWLHPFRWPENERIELVSFLPSHPPTLLVASNRELFFSLDEGETFESGFSLPFLSRKEKDEIMEERENLEEGDTGVRFTSFAFSQHIPSRIWLGTREGVYESRDGGVGWERLPEAGLEDARIKDLVFSDKSGRLIAATPSGIYQFRPAQGRWEVLPLRPSGPQAFIALREDPRNGEEILLVADGKEVLEWGLGPLEAPFVDPVFIPSPERVELLRKLFRLEPTVREVQQAAIRYGDLGNGKIKRWQWNSRLRAFVPRLTFSKDFSSSASVDIDRGGTNNPDVFILGPEEVDRGWDWGLSWELGDLLYSSAQTSIDSRAKLLVELRESILSQVTRIYFERRRIQMEVALSSPESLQQHFDLLLRLDELTAHLDGLTDGFLSRQLERIYETHPNLHELLSFKEESSQQEL